jgi:DNA helicase-2/ATP-dependent DNA helicase PcrA
MTDYLTSLNSAQRQAVEQTKGPLLILAGPGSGKTRVITHRAAHLVRSCCVSPFSILAVTFTNKAANVMKERLVELADSAVDDMTIGTFHAICARILRRDGLAIGVNPSFVIYDKDDTLSLIKRALDAIGLDPKQYSLTAITHAINTAKANMLPPQEYEGDNQGYFDDVVKRVYAKYQQLLTESNALDFDDLLLKTVQLFQQCNDVLAKYQARYEYIMVDEFQDTNPIQYALVKMLAAKHGNICVVGDPDQSIYSWRAADVHNILNFEKDYPQARVTFLEQNYRSTKCILEAASSIISSNRQRKPIDLWTDNDNGELLTVVEAYSSQEEAQFILNEIDRLTRCGISLSGCAVMYRTNAQSRAIEEACIRHGTNYRLVAGTRFYERREVKDIIAYLRLIINPADSVSLLRIINVPQRGIGKRSLGELSAWASSKGASLYETLQMAVDFGENTKPPINSRALRSMDTFFNLLSGLITDSKKVSLPELFDMVVSRSAYQEYLSSDPEREERWDNIQELRSVAEQYTDLDTWEALASFLERVSLVSDVDSYDEKAKAITLITLHQAKGLEFPAVFIVGLEEGVLPHYRSFDDPAQMEEERRLCYVGITRAKQRLYLLRAFKRNLMGGANTNLESRFLKDIPDHLIDSGRRPQGNEKKLSNWGDETLSVVELPELKTGDRVRHNQFGEGVVVDYQPVRDDAEVVVEFQWSGVKKLLFSFARLEKMG